MWGALLEDLKWVQRHKQKLPSMTMRDVVETIIKPETAGHKIGLGLQRNFKSPLRARVVVSHCWDEDYDQFVQALEDTGLDGPFWICSFALYQHFDHHMPFEKQFGKDPFSGPYRDVLAQAERLVVVVTGKQAANPLERLFCRAELACAQSLNKSIEFASVTVSDSTGRISDSLMELIERDNPELDVDMWEEPTYFQRLNKTFRCGQTDDVKSCDTANATHLIQCLDHFPNLHVHILQLQCEALKKHSLPVSEVAKLATQPMALYASFLQQRRIQAHDLDKALQKVRSVGWR